MAKEKPYLRGQGGRFKPSREVGIYGRKEEGRVRVPTRVGRLERRDWDWTSVSSSNISMIKYVNTLNQLSVEFMSGRRAVYYDVPWDVFEEFYYARSKGTFFYYEIRLGGYRWNYI